ncbi:hypothetical protein LOK49_LG13G01997 [Camellia lanceoleosa]|uniref:Uncharacterized protein n=1 Tax=Camellia lanceoleosa TaxID=1840588 RepID=A0ACC0FHF8_9ERIC|nr:hypothetical protein LOK49_LG13G01997 [Camellia lanceoleosa]
MAPKAAAEKKPAEEKKSTMAEKAPAEKKPKAGKKLPPETRRRRGRRRALRLTRSTSTMGIMNSFINDNVPRRHVPLQWQRALVGDSRSWDWYFTLSNGIQARRFGSVLMVAAARIEVVVASEALLAGRFWAVHGLRLTNRRWIESAVPLSNSVVLVSLLQNKD